MKNLKKVLVVVLVIAMAFSLTTIFASAADTDTSATTVANINGYTDQSTITDREPVDVLTALGILQGYDGAVFAPDNTVTREQAAKIITYVMIGTAAANGLAHSASSFSDVATDRWSNPFIEYCASMGIINGMGDGTFAPDAPVTAAQFAKLLLCAIGYGVKGEYTGDNWQLNAIVDGQNKGILTLNKDFTAPATRQDVARYAFNAITPSNSKRYAR